MIFTFEYDELGRRKKLTYPNGRVATYNYDAANRLIAISNGATSYGYSYDKANNITEITGTARKITYGYDKIYQLIDVGYSDSGHESYTYDKVGNRISCTTTEGSKTYQYDSANQLISDGESQYRYDLCGRLIEQQNGNTIIRYSYENNSLVSIEQDSNEIASYEYDPLGRRIISRHGIKESQFLWDGQALAGEYVGGLLKTIVCNGEALDEVLAFYTESSRYIHTDHLGSVTSATDSTNSLMFEIAYDSFGNPVSSISGETNLAYTGREFEDSIGLIYLRARFYDPKAGRFISRDPEQDGANPYLYCSNNPINETDPLGLWGETLHYGKPDDAFEDTYSIALDVGFTEEEARIIAEADMGVDAWYSNTNPVTGKGPYAPYDKAGNPIYHWDLDPDPNVDTRVQVANWHLDRAGKQKSTEDALKEIGKGLHAYQDVSAHGNWYPYEFSNWPYGKGLKKKLSHPEWYDWPSYDPAAGPRQPNTGAPILGKRTKDRERYHKFVRDTRNYLERAYQRIHGSAPPKR